MDNRMRRAAAAALCIVLLLSAVFGSTAYAFDKNDEVFTSSDGMWQYVLLADGSAGIFSNKWNTSAYLGNEKEITVPEYIDSYRVTQIGPFAFLGNTELVCVTVPEGISLIAMNAFEDCASLESVSLPNTLEVISDNAFLRCSRLSKINIPSGVTELCSSAFSGCSSLKRIEIPDGVTTAGDMLFDGCNSLEELAFPQNTVVFGNYVLNGCSSLKKVTVNYNPQADYSAIEDYVTDLIVPDGVELICENGVQDFTNLTYVYIGKNVESISEGIFSNSASLDTIVGYTGSYAEAFARNNSYKFISVGKLFEPFRDVSPDLWCFDAVNFCARNGYISGYQNGKFGPADTMQRQDFIVILARISGEDLGQYSKIKCALADVKNGSYYRNAVVWAVENKIIYGYADGCFGVGDKITREQICAVIYRFASYMKKDTSVQGSPEYVLRNYTDTNRVSSFAKHGVAWCVQNKIISGTGKYRLSPASFASRAEVAQIMANLGRNGYLAK